MGIGAMARRTGWILALVAGLGACSSNGTAPTADSGVITDVDAAIHSECNIHHDWCPVAPGVSCDVGSTCGPNARPDGVACSTGAICQMIIDSCPDWQRWIGGEEVDYDLCVCTGGQWACGLCSRTLGECVEAPDGAIVNPPVGYDAGVE